MSNQTENHKKTKVNLSKDLIIQTALWMIEESGIDGFSLRKLAQKLNCEAMSIYYHMKNKEQILDQIVDFLVSKINFKNQVNDPKEQLMYIAKQWRKLSQEYPKFFPILAVHPLNTDIGYNFMNGILLVFKNANLAVKDASYFLRILNYYLIGVGIDEAKGYQLAGKNLKLDKYPLLEDAKSYWTTEDQDQIFELGLNMLLTNMLHKQSE
ncbi:TetR/AcrR family transcriptional regulator [Acinetobacter guillouiae]|uniref:TetR/AcrR family transcriptional regulator n=1 Tax=Acinetobacter guillouiae TaxID=106649 RepID=UPI001AE152E2|nr:TetR/AcrR family transcriptional regulator C-terminal domain-containing protein [Acinetobacter guillouiae]MBP2543175.1 AcrR family transcriptional regulator [Acinetobacter guillouiae]